MNSKFPPSSAILRAFALMLICLCSSAAMAQEKGEGLPQAQTVKVQNPSVTVGSTGGVGASPVQSKEGKTASAEVRTAGTEPTPISSNIQVTAESNYKSSLNSLSTLYQNEVQRLEQKNNQAKELFKDGLISRVEMEAADKALADARAKVEDVAKQIAEANSPTPFIVAGDASNPGGSNQAWSTGNDRIDSLIRFYGSQHGVDPYLIYCLMSQESKFSKIATSPKGAQGLMQLMPGTAARYGVTNPYDVAQNISGGTRYLKDLLKMFNGRIDLALAGYNAGENAVIKYGYTIPPYDETRNYVKLIVKRYGATKASKVESPKSKVAS